MWLTLPITLNVDTYMFVLEPIKELVKIILDSSLCKEDL